METQREDTYHKLLGTVSANWYIQSLHKGLDPIDINLGGAA